MFERFTGGARRAVVNGQVEARRLSHDYIGTEHLLLGLLMETEELRALEALESLGLSPDTIRAEVEKAVGPGQGSPEGHLPFTPGAKKVLELSLREALGLGHNWIGPVHVLLGLVREDNGVAAQVLVGLGVDLSRAREKVIELIVKGGTAPSDPTPTPRELVFASVEGLVEAAQLLADRVGEWDENHNSQLAEAHATIEDLRQQLADSNRAVDEMNRMLAARDEVIVQLEQELAERSEACVRHEARIAELQPLDAEGQLATILAELREVSRLIQGRAWSAPPQPDLPV